MDQFTPLEVPITLTLNIREVNLILGALGSLPYTDVNHIITAIQSAGLQQMQEAERKHAASLEWDKAANEIKTNVEEAIQKCQTDQS